MEIQSDDPVTEFSDFFPEEEDEDEKRKNIKNMLKDLIKESKQIIKENEKKCTEEKKRLQSLPKLPTGIQIKINRQKFTSKQDQNVIQPIIKKTFPDPFKFKTNLPAGIKIVKLKKSPIQEEIIPLDSIETPPPPPASTSLDYIPKLPSGIKIVKLSKNQKVAEKPTIPLNNFPKLPPGIKVTQLKKPPLILEEESDKIIEDSFIDDDDFTNESSPINDFNDEQNSIVLVEVKCGVCEKTFSSLQLLENHSDCGKKIETKEYLTASSQIIKLKKVKTLRKLETKKYIKKVKTVPKIKPVAPMNNFVPKSWSEDCLKQFDSCNLLNQHELIKINSKNKFLQLSFVKCKICRTFHNNLDEMKEHIQKGHSEKQIVLAKKTEVEINKLKKSFNKGKSRGFICPICDDVEFKTLKTYNKHIMEEHKTVEKFPCKICGKILLTEIAFNSHMTLAHFKRKNLHQCIYCDVNPFCSEDILNNHIFAIHTDIDHKPIRNTCEICGKVFKRYDRKKRHVEEVHSNRIGFVCDICGISFKTTTSQQGHYRTHFEGSYHCDQCDGRFRHKQDLTIHQRLHSGERPYECSICYERFVANSNLIKHLRSRHVVKTGILVE